MTTNKILQFFIVSILLIQLVSSLSLYNRVDISNKTGAACLDGSNAAFYIWQP